MLLKEISNIPGPSGYEKPIRDYLKKLVRKNCKTLETDALGNIICFKPGKKKTPRIMLSAHMDEVGFIVSEINSDGFLKVQPLGGIDPRVVLTKKVYFPAQKIKGVVGVVPIHLLKRADEDKVPDWGSIYIDIGAKSKKDAEKYIQFGDVAVFDTEFEDLGDVYKGKSFDDRVGCYILQEILKKKFDHSIFGVFTTQEESGLRGVRPAVNKIKPDIAINLECTTAGDLPTKKDLTPSTELGKGPAITIMDRTSISSPKLVEYLVKLAKGNKIPYQFKRTTTGGTDAGYIHLSGEGVVTVTISVPARYIHSPASLISKSDLENAIKLVELAIINIDKIKL